MAILADNIIAPRPREILQLLAPFPGRFALVTRVALICALTVLITSTFGTPEAAISAYIVFFLNRPDRVTSIVISIALLLLVTVIIGFVIAVAIFSINEPALRVACIAVLSFTLLFVTSASKLRPIGAILAMIVGFGLDELGLVPLGEAATRALLYAWLMVAIPSGIAILVNLLIAPSPRSLAGAQLARRLRLASHMLASTATDADGVAFDACIRDGNHQLATWLKLSKFEGTSTAGDGAALGQAAASTTAILLAVDLAAREPKARLPADISESLAGALRQMAAILDRGGYPVDIALELHDAAILEPLAALVLADLRTAIEGFAIPEAAPTMTPPSTASAGRGFFNADAFSNPDHIRYALKTTAAAMFCYLLYQQLDWQGIHTCFITCYMVSLGTTAETVEKLTLRITGCVVGALLGTAALVFLIPALTSIGELMVLVFAGAWVAAWVAMGSPRVSYAGMQIAFAFFLCVIQGSGPGFDLLVARDRLIGILLGNVVVYLVFTRVWPVSIEKRVDAMLAGLLDQWARIARIADAGVRRMLAAKALAEYAALRQDLGLVHYEPSWVRPGLAWTASRRRALAELEALEAPLYFAAGRASVDTDARLRNIALRIEANEAERRHSADRIASPTPQPGRDRANVPSVDALLRLIDARLARIADASRITQSTETISDAPP
jgi:multidrug resistance protein MdtO